MATSSDFDTLARTRAHALVDALEKARADARQAEIDALRAFLEARAKEPSGAHGKPAADLVEPLVHELSAAARAEADERLKAAQSQADRALAEARDHAAAELRRAQEARDQVVADLHRAQEARDQAAAELQRAQDAREQTSAELRRAQEAREQVAGELRQLQESHHAMTAEFEDARQQLQAARALVSEQAARADRAEADVDAAQAASAALLADIEEAREALIAAERNAREAVSGRDEAAAAAQDLTERLAAAERALAEAHRAVPAQPARVASASLDVLDELATAMRAMRRATSGQDVFEVVVDCVAAHFERAAILIAGPAGLKCWLHRGFGDATPERMVLQSALGPAIRALDTQEVVEIDAAGAPLNGLCGGSISTVLAVPIVARGRTIAVAYAESAERLSKEALDAGRKIAEILIEMGSRRVNGKRSQMEETVSAEAQEAVYAIQRQARRVKMREAVNITLDGSASFLIDLSTIGAQVLSPVPLRPKQEVNIALVIGSRAVECRGRIVWALFEQPKGTRGALYRAGVEFIDVDARGVEAFLTSESRRLARSA